jgi:hypothetical protein
LSASELSFLPLSFRRMNSLRSATPNSATFPKVPEAFRRL